MGQSQFRAGQRVKIRSCADSDFAGYQGVIVFVGDTVCDVKIRYRPRGSKVSSTYIGTFSKSDLESFHKKMDLAVFSEREPSAGWRRPLHIALITATTIALLSGLVWWVS